MKSYLTLPEMFKALAEGKRVRKSYWPDGSFIHIVDGKVTDGQGCTPIVANFLNADAWEIFIEPKKPTKLYAYFDKIAGTTSFGLRFNASSDLNGYVRAPQFDTEVTLEN